jgi:hypothetical protein
MSLKNVASHLPFALWKLQRWGKIWFVLAAFVLFGCDGHSSDQGSTPQELDAAMAALEQRDLAAAIRIVRPLAEQGNAKAQSYLAYLLVVGPREWRGGVPIDEAESRRWSWRAAKQGDAQGELSVGFQYRDAGDYVHAYMWFSLAAKMRDPYCFDASRPTSCNPDLSTMAVQSRDFVAKFMTPTQIGDAQKLARDWKPEPE